MLEPALMGEVESMETDISFYTALHLTLCVLTHKNLAVLSVIKDKATVDAHLDMYRYTSMWCSHIHIGVGFGVARFDDWGHARAFMRGTSDKRTPHVVSFLYLPA